MAMAEKIKIALLKQNMSVKELAEKIGTSSQNLSGKFKRDNFSEKELIEISKAMNCSFRGTIIINTTGEEI